jgi:hypothetical protein
MNAYYVEVRKLEAHFEGLEFHHVSRDNNVAADVLSKLGLQAGIQARAGPGRCVHPRPTQAINQTPQRP